MGQLRLQSVDECVPAVGLDPGGDAAEPRKPATRREEILHRVALLVAGRQYDKAEALLKAEGRDRQIMNTRGVCLLRLGRYEEAVRLFRDLALHPGCTWMRPDLPLAYKTNFATALLLAGHPAGCLDVLAEVKAEQNLTVQRLRAAIKDWQARLPFWPKLNWLLGGIEPAKRPVLIDFVPGEFDFMETCSPQPRPVTPSPLQTAA